MLLVVTEPLGDEPAQPFCKRLLAETEREVHPFLAAMVLHSRFLPCFPPALPLPSISRRFPRRGHNLDTNLLFVSFPHRFTFLSVDRNLCGFGVPGPGIVQLLCEERLKERQCSTQTAHPYHGEVWFPWTEASLGPQYRGQFLQTSLFCFG